VDLLSHVIAIWLVDWSKSIRQQEARKVIGIAAGAVVNHWLVVTFVLFAITLIIISRKAAREVAAFDASHKSESSSSIVLDDDDIEVLKAISTGQLDAHLVHVGVGASHDQTLLRHLYRLQATGNVLPIGWFGSYSLTPKGCETLVARGLLRG
jgi:hypothetical protein